jgi:hypothetical protein
MPSFKDALKNYKTNTAATPAVNPPEALAIMEEKTVPETEGKAETEPLAVSKPAPKTRAPRGSKKASAEPTASTDLAPATEEPASEGKYDSAELDYLMRLVRSRLPPGVTVTITSVHS